VLFNRALACLNSDKLDAAAPPITKRCNNRSPNSFWVAWASAKSPGASNDTNEAIKNYKLYLPTANTNTAEATNVMQRSANSKGHSP